MKAVIKTIGKGIVQYVLKNPKLMLGAGMMGGAYVTALLTDKGVIKTTTREEDIKLAMTIGLVYGAGEALLISGVVDSIALWGVNNSHVTIGCGREDDYVMIGTGLDKFSDKPAIWGAFSKESALKIGNDIIEEANKIV